MLYQKEIASKGPYDVVVCGGGFSGFAAAYAAAREGVKVLLLERGGCLGGVGTQAMVNHILGARALVDDGYATCVGGLFDRIEQELVKNGDAVDVDRVNLKLNPHGWLPALGIGLIFDPEAMKLLLEQLLAEVGAEILYYSDIIDVVKEEEQVSGVIIHNKSGLQLIEGKCFVDATGDGDVAAYAGCSFDFGDEEGGLAAASLEMHVENVDRRQLEQYMAKTQDVRFRAIIGRLKEEGKWPFPYEIFISVQMTKPGVFMINTIRQVGIDGTNAGSLSRGVTEGRKGNYELLQVMRKYFPGFQNAVVRQIAPVIGIRESRRIRCQYTLSVADLIEGTEFEDGIALSGYGWDMPNPKKPSLQPYHGVERKSPIAQIPYRSLCPMGPENLILAGRCIGVEREALGVVRVMGPCLAMGEAAGIAAAMAVEMADQNKIDFAGVDIIRLKEKIHQYGGLTEPNQVK